MLTDEQIEAVRIRCGGKVGVVTWYGHQLVFRRPSRDQVRDYRRKQDTSEKPDALDQFAQVMIVCFDGEQDPTRARVAFTGSFLEEYPAFTSSARFMVVANSLAGLIELEESADLGKGASVRSSPPRSTPTASTSGPATFSADLTPPSPMTGAPPPS